MYKLLLIAVCFKLTASSIIVSKEDGVKRCVENIIETLIPTDHTVLYFYKKTKEYLPDVKNPKIIVNVTKRSLIKEAYKTYNEMVILEIMDWNSIGDYLRTMNNNGFLSVRASPKRKYLLISSIKVDYMKQILSHLFKHDITDVIFLTFTPYLGSSSIRIYTSDPHHVSNECGANVNALEVYDCSTIDDIKKPSVLEKYRNCNLTYVFEVPHMLNKYGTELNYMTIFAIESISKTLNQTLVIIPARNMETAWKANKPLVAVQNFRLCTSTDSYSFSLPYYRDDWAWIVPIPNQIDPLEVFKIIFKTTVWVSILATFIIASTVWWLIVKCTRVSSLSAALLNMYSATLFGTINRIPSSFQLRILFIAYVIYALPIQTSFTSSLVRLLTVPQYERSITTLEELAESSLPIVTADEGDSLFKHREENGTLYTTIRNKFLVINGKRYENCLRNINKNKNYTIIMVS
ncbi:hypothetical protein FQA39_LY10867 [Lamprigera yunnana]|nr:hypothetical protein FQA39_LY10867 [Lamprigera yunnana]